uniref:Sulfate_transp domain-containing protein n=1 Tax=Dracunculus medinensis TaxID=318479 RepID=A0A158Q396_DRAME
LNILFGFIPILHWLPKYKIREYLLNDLIGGFTVGIMHVPQGMAYASLAGLDPINGLYTSFFPPLIYMFFGTSRHISLGVFAIVSLMVGSTNIRVTEEINQFAITQNLTTLVDGLRYVVTALTLCVGLIQIVMGLLRLDFLTQYMSDQVIKGFTTGAAVHVFVAQLNKLIGVPLSRHSGFGKLFKVIRDLYEELSSANMVTITISTINIIVLYVCKNYLSVRLKKVSRIPVPFDLIIVIIGLIISKVLQLETSYNVQVVGNIPIGLPSPAMPKLSLFPYIWSDALAISIIVIVVGVSMGSLFAKKNNYAIDIRQEFYAMGLTECGSSLFPCWPAATALARSVIYESAGTKTQVHAIILLRIIKLYFLVCILSSVIIVALKGIFIQFLELETLWLQSKIDFVSLSLYLFIGNHRKALNHLGSLFHILRHFG